MMYINVHFYFLHEVSEISRPTLSLQDSNSNVTQNHISKLTNQEYIILKAYKLKNLNPNNRF